MMLKPLLTIFLTAIFLLPRPAFAELRAEELELTCAIAAMAAYSSETSQMLREELMARGWDMKPFEAYSDEADAKALLLRREDIHGRAINILSICGTEDQKDVEIDARFKLTAFDDGVGLVHQGFNDYTNVLINSEEFKKIVDVLQNSYEMLYITGHSLGGAVAILTAAHLAELDIGEQIAVMTFGAPAVGDQAFADRFDGKIALTRITASGDPIKKALRKLGYVNFGNSVKYIPAKSVEHFRHKMAVYLDCALRHYCEANFDEEFNSVGGRIYVAPLRIMQRSFERADEKYVNWLVRDTLRTRGADMVFGSEPPVMIDYKTYNDDFAEIDKEYIDAARAAGCDRILLESIQSKRVREARRDIDRIIIEKLVCDLKGFPIEMQTSSMNTNEVTALEAVMLAQWKSSL